MKNKKWIYIALIAVIAIEICVAVIFLMQRNNNPNNQPSIRDITFSINTDTVSLTSRLPADEVVSINFNENTFEKAPIDMYDAYLHFNSFKVFFPDAAEEDWEAFKDAAYMYVNTLCKKALPDVDFAKNLSVSSFGASKEMRQGLAGAYQLSVETESNKLTELAEIFKTVDTYTYIAFPAVVSRNNGESYQAILLASPSDNTTHITVYFAERSVYSLENESLTVWVVNPTNSTEYIACFTTPMLSYQASQFESYVYRLYEKIVDDGE